jgi:hypothetical protein
MFSGHLATDDGDIGQQLPSSFVGILFAKILLDPWSFATASVRE